MQVQAPAGREMPADAQHELARLGIAVVGPAAPNLVTFPLGQVNAHVRLWIVQSLPSTLDLPAKTSASLLWMERLYRPPQVAFVSAGTCITQLWQ